MNPQINLISALSGKTMFITGASRGIGAAAAKRASDCGANVVLAARSSKDIDTLAAEIGEKALAVPCNVADYEQMKSAMDQAVSHFGSLDILVNNAGVIDPIGMIEESDPSAWGKVVDINLKGVYHGLHAAFPHLEKTGKGLVINISSGAASSTIEGWAHYCATKAAVLSLTRCVNHEWRNKGVSVVGLSPGTVATDMQMAIKQSGINAVSKLDWDDHISPDWVAEAICWLTTDAARKFDGTDFSLKTDEGRRLVGLE